jgi:formylglycine-generating enzyme required for sulfatase activity
MYATSANSVASDGTGRNGLFSNHLLNNIRTPGLSVFEVFDRTMGDVSRATNGSQQPELSLRFSGATSAYLGPRPVQPNPSPSPSPTPAVVPVVPSVQPVSGNMVLINGGTFMMGSPVESGVSNQVTLTSYYMGKYLVTQKEWTALMGTTVRQQRDKRQQDSLSTTWSMSGEGDNYPMYYVSWYEAVEYCNRLSQKEGLTPAYTINKNQSDPNNKGNDEYINWTVTLNKSTSGYRLPTEAEWEYACRAGTTTAYNTGAAISDSTGWYDANSGNTTHPVGQKPANAWGLYDMHGNVEEWCWDWYGNYSSEAQTDPKGASSGKFRIQRGGCYYYSALNVSSMSRGGGAPSVRFNFLGFRLVRP